MSKSRVLRSISFVMPVLNEEKYLARAVQSIFEQKNIDKGQIEVILALGPSTDGTNSVAEALKAQYPVKTVSNPSGKTPSGLNLAISASNRDVVVRVDAHSQLSPEYTSLALEILNQTGAANTGGIMKAVGFKPFQKAVAWAYGSRFGLGGGTFHIGGEAGPSDSVYLGVFRREVLSHLGGFNEKMLRGQDWELNLRIRQSGQIVWFDPRLQVTYFPRSSLKALIRQFFDTGLWRAELTRSYLSKANLRYFAPPALVLFTVLGFSMFLLGFGGFLGLIPLFGYLAAIGAISLTSSGLGFRAKIALLAALPAMHFSWGLGFIAGLFHKR